MEMPAVDAVPTLFSLFPLSIRQNTHRIKFAILAIFECVAQRQPPLHPSPAFQIHLLNLKQIKLFPSSQPQATAIHSTF